MVIKIRASDPSAKDWLEALKIASSKLKQCNLQKNHIYSQTYGKCYWCERKAKLGEDIFCKTRKLLKL